MEDTISLVEAKQAPCLYLVQEILLGHCGQSVAGRLDHFACNAAENNLYVACLGNNSVAVIDARIDIISNKQVHSN